MAKPVFLEMDKHACLKDQLCEGGGAFVLINHFTIDPADSKLFVEAWTEDAEFFRSQPGYISTQLHCGIAGSGSYPNYALWESVETYRAAFERLQAESEKRRYPEGMTVSPHLFRKIAVPGLCVA